ncbi:hypothetical protein [Cellulosimicrobium arenosum]|uniref:Terminase n=1 Tax=Cellulosimicrobium arenosum TaxID=2708133 RepID=A0A927G6Z4_9MICO|nr:hypothetical protein [Cellulosimicrobium arenosum]MBD8077689.1 hypothetical protein [Cellulosimicrobium arenosum]
MTKWECLAVSDFPVMPDVTAYEVGSELLGFDTTPQGYVIAGVVEARNEEDRPLYRYVPIQVPRRSAKTTSTSCVALGRMVATPGYRVMSTAQTGDIARRMWREVVQLLDAHYASVDEGSRPYKARIANGSEVLTWENGSTWRPVTPSPLSYRSQAADLLIFEESGHIAPELAAELRAGAFPTMDTRPQGQVWIIGTPGPTRAGLLWDGLVKGHAGRARWGLVDFTIGDSRSITHEDGSLDLDLLQEVHPGLRSGLTDLDIMEERFEGMSVLDFAAEYAGQWPPDASTSAIDLDAWAASALTPLPSLEDIKRFGLAFDVAPDGSSAALCAAWRDEDGVAHLGVIEHRAGVSWLADVVHAIATKYRLPVAYDGIGANHGPAQEIERKRGVNLVRLGMHDVQAAAQGVVSHLTDGRLRHYSQGSLTGAAEGASWRSSEGGRLFGRRRSTADASPLVAASLALAQYDALPAESGRLRIAVARSS